MKKLPIGIPIVASLAAFVLVLLALLAGSRQGFLEDCDIVTFNTSSLGKNLIITAAQESSTPTSTSCGTGWEGKFCSVTTAIATAVASGEAAIESGLNDIENDIADELAAKLGIQEFYSLHVMDICEGNYRPNATVDGSWRNVTNCTTPIVAGYNISARLDHELGIGPLKINLADLGFSRDMQDDMDTLHKVTEAFAIILIIGVGFTGLSLLCSLAALFLIPGREGLALLFNLVLSALAAGILVLAAVVMTVGTHVAVNKANSEGADVGLSAAVGTKFEALMWTGTGLMAVACAWWAWHRAQFRRGYRLNAGGGRGARATRHRHIKHVRDSEDSTFRTQQRPRSFGRLPQMVHVATSRFRESSMS